MDILIKVAHFCPLNPSFTAAKVALVFLNTIVRLHGLPQGIVSDRDPIFLSTFWKQLMQHSGTTLKYSTAYHSQHDGQLKF